MSGRMKGKVVTGAGSAGPGWGNGEAAALYVREGARVFAVDHRLEAAAETERIVAAERGERRSYATDMSRPNDVAEMVAACVAAFGWLEVLHNSVGIAETGEPVEASEKAGTASSRSTRPAFS